MPDRSHESGSAITEAKALYRMVAIGSMSVADVHELIDLPTRVRRALVAARDHDMVPWLIDEAMGFRAATRRHFDAMLVKAGRA